MDNVKSDFVLTLDAGFSCTFWSLGVHVDFQNFLYKLHDLHKMLSVHVGAV